MNNSVTIHLSCEGEGFATRIKGERLRGLVEEKLASVGPGSVIVIDFADVPYMTPSFADEFIGKLAESMGREAFRRQVRLVNASATVRSLVNAVLTNRLARIYRSKTAS